MSLPRVTVIIATYNWSTVLPYAIQSVLAQTMPEFELLVVGDGCTDDCEQVVTAIKDPRVRWINLPANTGHQARPNNRELQEAKGELIAYLGHDDLWLPHHLQCMVNALDTGSAGIAHTMSRTDLFGAHDRHRSGHAGAARPQADPYSRAGVEETPALVGRAKVGLQVDFVGLRKAAIASAARHSPSPAPVHQMGSAARNVQRERRHSIDQRSASPSGVGGKPSCRNAANGTHSAAVRSASVAANGTGKCRLPSSTSVPAPTRGLQSSTTPRQRFQIVEEAPDCKPR